MSEKITDPIAWFDILRFVANECHNNPNDSVKDILNEAFDDAGMSCYAEWSDDDSSPISILSCDEESDGSLGPDSDALLSDISTPRESITSSRTEADNTKDQNS